MSRSILALVPFILFAAACDAPPVSEDSVRDPATATVEPLPEAPPIDLDLQAPGWITASFIDPDDNLVLAGEFCSEISCAAISNGLAVVPVPTNSDVELFLTGPGLVPTVYQVAYGDAGHSSHVFPAETEAHLDALADAFGVVRDRSGATIIQRVYDGDIEVTLEGAEGPFYTDWDGNPQPKSTATPPDGGGYVFFNVQPGAGVIEFPGCNEGYVTWGPGADEAIDIVVEADDTLLLPSLRCQ